MIAPVPFTPVPCTTICRPEFVWKLLKSSVVPALIVNVPPVVAPSAPVLPAFSTPDTIVIGPENVFAPDKVKVPGALICTAPVPAITFENVVVSLRSSTSVPLLVTMPEPSKPVVPPLPTSIVPLLIVVPPEYVLVLVIPTVFEPFIVSVVFPPIAPPLNV